MDFSILVVDDEINIARSLQMVLSKKYKTFITSNIEEMLKIIHDKQISLVIIDYNLTETQTGVDFATKIKNLYPLCQIILFTGNSDYSVIKEALNSGAITSFMNKPVEKDELFSFVENNYQIWEQNNMKMEEVVEQIKEGKLDENELAQFGNSTPLLNLLVSESVKILKAKDPKIVGITINREKNRIYEKFYDENFDIRNNALFFMFIETLQKMGKQLFKGPDVEINEINLNNINLILKSYDDILISLFVINPDRISNKDIITLLDDIFEELKDNEFVVDSNNEKIIEEIVAKYNNKLENIYA